MARGRKREERGALARGCFFSRVLGYARGQSAEVWSNSSARLGEKRPRACV